MWYRNTFNKTALRKHSLNVDLHIHALEDPQSNMDAYYQAQYIHINDILSSAIIKGLDIIGIVSRHSFQPGLIANQIISEKNYDIIALGGVETDTNDGYHIIIYNAKTVPNNNESYERISERAHKEGGVVMVIQPSRRNVQKMNKMVGTEKAPDFIEMFNDITQGGYSKAFVDTSPSSDFQIVMNSASRNARDLDKSVMMTRIPRKKLIEKGVIGEEEGVDFTPSYLREENRGLLYS